MQYFGSIAVEGVAESWVEAGMSWVEVEMSWVEVDGGGWSWVEVGAPSSNTHNLIVHNLLINYLNLIKEPMQKQLLTGVL